ncbi:MAG: peptidylprolyl isomerase [Candidatus Sumerlaeia bacterium]|nr:peptidylprolyl isomerase [Candidatus Sumerlaeia bacterium]
MKEKTEPTSPQAAVTPTPAPPASGKPVVVLTTSLGVIEIELDPVRAPVTTENFLYYVHSRHYDGTIFHRVIGSFVIQGGGFTPDMKQKETAPPIVNESGNGLSNVRGAVAMARTQDLNSATSQFYINVVDNYNLDAMRYCVFGKVIAGMDVVDKIRAVPTQSVTLPNGTRMEDVPVVPVVILSAQVK